MATVTIVFEDAVSGTHGMETGINVFIESADPAVPLKDGDIDLAEATPAQQAMRLCLGELMDAAGFAELFTASPDDDIPRTG